MCVAACGYLSRRSAAESRAVATIVGAADVIVEGAGEPESESESEGGVGDREDERCCACRECVKEKSPALRSLGLFRGLDGREGRQSVIGLRRGEQRRNGTNLRQRARCDQMARRESLVVDAAVVGAVRFGQDVVYAWTELGSEGYALESCFAEWSLCVPSLWVCFWC